MSHLNLIPGEIYFWWDRELQQVNIGKFICMDSKSRMCVLFTTQPYFVPLYDLRKTQQEAADDGRNWSTEEASKALGDWMAKFQVVGVRCCRDQNATVYRVHLAADTWEAVGQGSTWEEAVQDALYHWDRRGT